MQIGVRPADAKDMLLRSFKTDRMSGVPIDLGVIRRDEPGQLGDVPRVDDFLYSPPLTRMTRMTVLPPRTERCSSAAAAALSGKEFGQTNIAWPVCFRTSSRVQTLYVTFCS
jgi:hypothetical protein